MRSSIIGCQLRASFAQSRVVGVLLSGSALSASPISPSVSPTRWATLMKLTRRSTSGRYRRCPDSLRSDVTRPFAS